MSSVPASVSLASPEMAYSEKGKGNAKIHRNGALSCPSTTVKGYLGEADPNPKAMAFLEHKEVGRKRAAA